MSKKNRADCGKSSAAGGGGNELPHSPPQAITATLGKGVYDAWAKYNKALSFDLLSGGT